MDAPISTQSSVSSAYANQNALNQKAKESREAERVQQIKTALDKAAGHVSNNKPVEAYYGYLALAEGHDDPEAQYQVGLMLKEGRGVERNEVEASVWLSKAAEQGDQRAHLEMGKRYALGIGVPKNYTRAIAEFKLAAGPDGNEAVDALWQMHAGRYGLKQDNVQEKEKYERALTKTRHEAYCELGKLHSLGYGQEQDYQEKTNYQIAVECFDKAEQGGSKTAPAEKAKLVERGLVVDGNKAPAPLDKKLARLENDYGADYSQELAACRKGIQTDDPQAFYRMGMLYLEGHGVEKSLPRALEYLEKAAHRHDREAKYQLTRLFNNQTDIKLPEIVACYEAAVNNNAPWALVGMGKMYALGLGVQKNIAGAICLFKIAAELNNPYALYELAKLYVLGYGQEEKYVEAAIVYFKQAMAGGVPETQCELGRMCYWGCGVDKDYELAFKHFQAAAEQGVPEALFYLGWMYEKGHGVQRNSATAVEKYKEAAALSSAKAMNMLGYMYQHAQGVAQDYASALKYYRAAAALGHREAIHNLGFMYSEGKGVATNQAEAIKLYRQSAALGCTFALYNLGLNYRDGQGVPQDSDAAIDCLRRAAELGHKDAWVALEQMEKNNQGDVRDYPAARAYYEQAYKEGLPRANEGYRNDYGDAASTILRFYQKRAEQNDPRALYNLGMLHLEGRGVEKNLDIAMRYLNQAAKLGDAEAKNRISKMPELTYGVMSLEDLAVYIEAAKQYKTWGLLALGKLYVDGIHVERDRLKGWGYLDELVSLEGLEDLDKADQLRIAEARELIGKLKFRVVRSSQEKSTRFPIDLELGNSSYLKESALNETL